jgi:hypothetical protein
METEVFGGGGSSSPHGFQLFLRGDGAHCDRGCGPSTGALLSPPRRKAKAASGESAVDSRSLPKISHAEVSRASLFKWLLSMFTGRMKQDTLPPAIIIKPQAVEPLGVLLAGDLPTALPVCRRLDEPRFQMPKARSAIPRGLWSVLTQSCSP